MRVNETNQSAEGLGLAALGWTLQDGGRADRLLALTGLTPHQLRSRLGEPSLLSEVLRFLEAYEPDLLACAEALQVAAAQLVQARRELER